MVHTKAAKCRPDLIHEFALHKSGLHHVAGLDEAGRGAWAGPVTAAAVILPLDRSDLIDILEGVRDSKQMSPSQREHWASRISQVAIAIGTGAASAKEVDSQGLIAATRAAMIGALEKLPVPPEHLLIDHLHLPKVPLPQTAITRGDAQTLSIAAASVIAKVTRDRVMISFEDNYPGYGFANHKGYGTAAHRAALQNLGPCPIHRRSYAPVAACSSHD